MTQRFHPNPWGLTAGQARVMTAWCETGCHKLASAALGLTVKSIEAHCHKAHRKIGARTSVQKLLLWDRWMRGPAREDDDGVRL